MLLSFCDRFVHLQGCVCVCVFAAASPSASCRQNKSSHAVCSLRLLLPPGSHCAKPVVGTLRGLCLPVTHVLRLLGSLEAKVQTVYSCLARRREYFESRHTIFGLCFLINAFLEAGIHAF